MSLVGIGIDLVSVKRMDEMLARHPQRFPTRCFRGPAAVPGALAACEMAGLWAAKEAFLKALGSGIGEIPYRDIEIIRTGEDSPAIMAHGRAALALARTGAQTVNLSVGRDGDFAVASVILEK